MKIAYFPNQIALNAPPVMNAFLQGCKQLGIDTVPDSMDADAAVIWSFLWAGRMRNNKNVYDHYRSLGRNVFIIEVGMIKRGHTWKLCINSTVGSGYYGTGIEANRAKKLGVVTAPWQYSGQNIVIALQRSDSGQWQEQPSMDTWLSQTVTQLRMHTDRPIVVRPHPRQRAIIPPGVTVQHPHKLAVDHYDFDSALNNVWAVINFNSGPGNQAIISGIPAFVDSSSLAAEVANLDLADIEKPTRHDRHAWLEKIVHTEWTVEEISTGFPITRLLRV